MKEGGDWERELFRESLSFAGSAGLGALTINVGLRLLIFATPYGWAGLLAGGLITAAISAGTAVYVDNVAQNNSDKLYQRALRLIGSNGY